MTALAAGILMVVAVPEPARAERLPIKRYTTADGLPHDRIKCIIQDARGFLWFCTVEGLSRFDGYGFKTYSTADGLPEASVNHVLEDGAGRYWVATNGGGVCRFVASTSRCQPYPVGKTLMSTRVNMVHKDRKGRLWAATDGGLFRLDGEGAGERFKPVDLGLKAGADVHVWAFVEDGTGRLWIGATSGLFEAQADGHVRRHPLGNDSAPDRIRALALDPSGRLWLAHTVGVLVVQPRPADAPALGFALEELPATGLAAATLGPGRGFVLRGIPGTAGQDVMALFRSGQGHIWIGTRDTGLARFDGQAFRGYAAPAGISHVGAITFAEDREGNLWVGTEASGALKVSRNGFTSYDQSDGLRGDWVSSIFEDRAGDLVVLTISGFLNRFDGERFTAVRPPMPEGFASQAGIRDGLVLQDHAGDWWLRSSHGLFRFTGSLPIERLATAHGRRYTTADGLAGDNVSQIFEDSRKQLWIASSSPAGAALQSWEPSSKTFQQHVLPPPPAGGSWSLPQTLEEDPAGGLWIGFGAGHGLVRYRDGRFVPTDSGDIRPWGVYDLHFDQSHRLWVAQPGTGLLRVDEPEAESPRAAVAGFGRGATCITDDKWGQLYVGTYRGVDRLDPATSRIKHYTTADGLAQNEVKTCFRDRHDRLWFGTIQGLSSFVPERESPRVAPGVLVSALRIAGTVVPVSAVGETSLGGITLPPDRNQIQIDFVSLAFGSGEALRYQYRLEGAERTWSVPAGERTVNYARLAPGSYRFMVRAVNADDLTSPQPASVTFDVLAPVWRRWWFLALAAVALSLAAYRLHRYRLGHLLELERVRTRIASDLHDDIGSTLSQISILGAVAQAQVGPTAPGATESLSLIGRLARESMDSMSDIVWAINPRHDRLTNLTHRMRRLASELLPAQGIDFAFEVNGSEADVSLGADLRRQVFLIFKESLNNALRHSGCAKVEIELHLDGGWLALSVLDDGRGFDPEAAADGHGLQSLRRRAEALGGTLAVTSTAGTHVLLRVPFAGSRRHPPAEPTQLGG